MKHKNRIKRDQKEESRKTQLCWSCKNACGGCSWSREFKPIKGWNATPTKLLGDDRYIDSFKIVECPEYIKDREV